MAINYASKYAAKIDERFSREALSGAAINNDYDFVGTKTVNVYSVPTAAMNDYSRTGANRYGTPAELENSIQEMTMRKDRSFTFTIDRGNFNDTQMANSAGQALQRQLTEVVIPEIDTYRFATICANAGTSATADVTSENAYSVFLDGTTALIDNLVPMAGAVLINATEIEKDKKFTFSSTPQETFVLNDVKHSGLSNNFPESVKSLSIIIFARQSTTVNRNIKMRCYKFIISEKQKEIRNFIPCKNPQNEIGMYDTVTQTFYGNAGTGEFIAGPVVTQ